MPIHTGRLLLSTRDPLQCPDRARLTASLLATGFIGSPLADRDDAFVIGEHFFELIAFTGCAVHVESAPDAKAPFCHIRIVGPFARPRFMCGRNTRPPRCPSCRTPFPGWKEQLGSWNQDPGEVHCPACGDTGPPWVFDWKEKAGFARLFVQVEEVFPGEATPTPGLMGLLEGSTGVAWRYFYVQEHSS